MKLIYPFTRGDYLVQFYYCDSVTIAVNLLQYYCDSVTIAVNLLQYYCDSFMTKMMVSRNSQENSPKL